MAKSLTVKRCEQERFQLLSEVVPAEGLSCVVWQRVLRIKMADSRRESNDMYHKPTDTVVVYMGGHACLPACLSA